MGGRLRKITLEVPERYDPAQFAVLERTLREGGQIAWLRFPSGFDPELIPQVVARAAEHVKELSPRAEG